MADGETLIGKQLGNYRVLKRIGKGGFGVVYEAQHVVFNNIVAIKVPLINYYWYDEQAIAKFCGALIHEARMLQQLTHPYILPVIDAGETTIDPSQKQKVVYIVMEFASGGSLLTRLEKHSGQPLPLDEAVIMLGQIGQALHFAHQPHQQREPVVHRDLKPANILFDDQGDALLADFGLAIPLPSAKTMRINEAAGTPNYMAPEQFDGDISTKSDQYSLGCIAYELLTGQHPFSNNNGDPRVMIYKHQTVTPEAPIKLNPRLPTFISDAILKAMAKNRADRHESVLAFIKLLRQRPGSSPPPKSFTELYIEGNELYERGKYSEAITAYQQVIALIPSFADAHVNEGLAHYRLKQYEYTLHAFERAIGYAPHHVKAHFHKGLALSELGKHTEAVEAYKETVQLDPGHRKAYLYLGDENNELQQYNEAIRAYKQALGLNPDEVVRTYKRASSDSQDADIYTNLGIALKSCRKYTEALAAFNCAIALDPALAQAYYNKGNVFYDCQQYGQALDAYDEAIRIKPDYAQAYFSKGNVFYDCRKYDAALEAYNKAINIDPHYARAYYTKSQTLSQLGRSNEARQAREMASRLGYPGP